MDNIRKIFKGQEARLVVGIGTYETPRSLRIMREKFGIEFPLFFLPMAESSHIFPPVLENMHYPYLFVINKELIARYTFIPSSTFPHISIHYYNGIKERLTENKTIALFLRQQMNVSEIKLDKEYVFQFPYSNPTSQPVIINDIKTTCGCTVPSWEKEPLLPGKTASLTIKFKPNTLGFHAKKIFVYTNLTSDPIPLLIKAVVVK